MLDAIVTGPGAVIPYERAAIALEERGRLKIRAITTTIRIAHAQDFTPAPYTVMGWQVSDIEDVVDWLQARGVAMEKYPFVPDRDRGIWAAPTGDKAAWFKDPDGNVLSVSQHV